MNTKKEVPKRDDRRLFTRRRIVTGGFFASLAAAYSLFAVRAIQFVFPERKSFRKTRIFLAFTSDIPQGESKSIPMPSGDQLLLSSTRRVDPNKRNTYVAFSSSCPHLGCRVHWDSLTERFLCPCHQGVFNAKGLAISGPPAQSGSNLKHYPVEVSGNSIYAVVEEV